MPSFLLSPQQEGVVCLLCLPPFEHLVIPLSFSIDCFVIRRQSRANKSFKARSRKEGEGHTQVKRGKLSAKPPFKQQETTRVSRPQAGARRRPG